MRKGQRDSVAFSLNKKHKQDYPLSPETVASSLWIVEEFLVHLQNELNGNEIITVTTATMQLQNKHCWLNLADVWSDSGKNYFDHSVSSW